MVLVGAVGILLAVNAAGADAAPTASADSTVQSVPGTSALNDVACTSKASCVAVGSVDGEGVVVPINNGVPGPAQVLSDTDTLTSVTCTKPGTCIAAGLAETELQDAPNSTGGAVVRISDGQASLADIFLGIGMVYTPDRVYGRVGIACSDTAHCMAVGTSTYEAGLADNILNDGSTPVQSISPVSMSGVECVREDWCVADGQSQPEQRFPDGAAEFVQIGGAKGHISIRAIVEFAERSNLYAGTCRNGSLEFCQMAGVVGDEGAVFSVVGESTGLTRPVAGTSVLNDLACAGSYWCLAVGQTTGGVGAVVPVGWEDPTTLQTVTGVDQFSGVSCPTQHFCIAVGTTGTGNRATGVVDTFPVWG